MNDLQAIIDYEMTPLEAKAYKALLLWEEISQKELPKYRMSKRGNGDPRKTLTFKHCYKLVVETNGTLKDEDLRLYVIAQIQSMKSRRQGEVHALVEPHILTGKNAWFRWEEWKRQYDHDMKEMNSENILLNKVTAEPTYVKNQLVRTKKFFQGLLSGGLPNYAQIELCVKQHMLVKWLSYKSISPYYIVLSPLVARALKKYPDPKLSVDPDIYLPDCNSEVKDFFKQEFPGEFT